MKKERNYYLVGELADYFGVSRDTLRLYDKVGILSPSKNEENQYRTYSRADFICLDYIMRLRKLNMSLDDIKMMINDCTIEHAEAVMQIQAKILDDKIKELNNLKLMVEDYQKSFSKAIASMGQITIEYSPNFVYMDVKGLMKDAMVRFNKLSVNHVPKFTFVADRDRFLNMAEYEDFCNPEVREKFFQNAITLVDDEDFEKSESFANNEFKMINLGKCVHSVQKTYTNKNYEGFYIIRDYILDNNIKLSGNPIFRALSVRNNIIKSVDYYDIWIPIE